MKRNLFFMALSAMALVTSCSNDEVTEVSDSNAIKFDVTAGNITRAANVYCNTNKFSSFYVWANLGGNPYIAGDKISSTDGTTWEDETGTRYWPNTGSLDFYGVVNGGTLDVSTRTLPVFTVAGEVDKQLDLCYAVKKNQAKGTGNASSQTVALNFRHALSQIVFKAKNINPKLYVEIDGVAVYNVKNSAVFTLPDANTDKNITDHTHGIHTFDTGSQGTWGTYGESYAKYVVDLATPVELVGSETATAQNLTDDTRSSHLKIENPETDNPYKNAMLLLPMEIEGDKVVSTTPWKGNGLTGVQEGTYTANKNDGTLILVKCRIWNVAGDAVVKEGDKADVVLYENEGKTTRWAAIPATFAWEQGKKYIYTLVFNNGNGGIDPDPDDPKPVLVKIDYTVDVDDFVQGANEDITMDKELASTSSK